MCGIFGCYCGQREVSDEAMSAALNQIEHRGPDGRGVWVSEDRRVGLGHVRLSLVGVDSGTQPIHSEDGFVHVVVNGEFYEHERIRRELEGVGHLFSTDSDSEIAVHLYEELGTEFIERLRGEFAFLLWDERNGAFLAARDRFGIKPLYYTWFRGDLLLASEIKALLATGVPAEWDRESVFHHLHLCMQNNRTVFRGIYHIPPGHILCANQSGWRLVEYWDMKYPRAGLDQEPVVSEADAVDSLRRAIFEATELRLRAEVPVGLYLSGGIDSCGLLGIAAALGSVPPQTFTVQFTEDGYDESPIAKRMAAHVGTAHHVLEVTADHRADHFRDALRHSELPTGGSNLVGKYLLSRLARSKGVKAVITGEGADEIFGGYSYFRRDMALHHSSSADRESALGVTSGIVEGSTISDFGASSLDSVEQLLGYTPSAFLRVPARAAHISPYLSAGFKAEFSDVDSLRSLLFGLDLRRLRAWDRLNQSLYICAKTSLATNLLNRLGDRSEMAHSVEGRTPFLDHHLVELVNKLPIGLKIKGTCEKFVLREAVREFVPAEVYVRTKHSFLASSELSGRFGEMVYDTLQGTQLDTLPFCDVSRIRRIVDTVQLSGSGENPQVESFLTHVASLCHLQELFAMQN